MTRAGRTPINSIAALPDFVPVLIAGGGPVGLTLAALLGRFGVRCLVAESDASWCEGSRAICVSRRSQEILAWAGADGDLIAKGLGWSRGRSFYRDAEVLQFEMPNELTQRFAPMLNIQQFYVEQCAHAAAVKAAEVDVRWSTRLDSVRPHDGGAEVGLIGPDAVAHAVKCRWLVACDGGRSTVRERLGMQLEGTQYEGRYVIVDIEQDTRREVERLAWFDPPSNPGSTILMHRQPDNIWRIDYQLGDGEDPAEAVKPDNVLPRVRAHLEMIGESAPWRPLWISIYSAKCLTLPCYRSGPVLFAGDAAHLVPIFGVRGLNSGLDDAGNLAWKLSLVERGRAPASLLDTYSDERVLAARQNILYGAKSTEFMAPPHHGFALMREAALRLAASAPAIRSLINPRQSAPVEYRHSSLNRPDCGEFADGARAGMPAPEARLRGAGGAAHMTSFFGSRFVALYFGDEAPAAALLRATAGSTGCDFVRIARRGQPAPALFIDDNRQAWPRYDAEEATLYVIRPDGYVMQRWRGASAAPPDIELCIARVLGAAP